MAEHAAELNEKIWQNKAVEDVERVHKTNGVNYSTKVCSKCLLPATVKINSFYSHVSQSSHAKV